MNLLGFCCGFCLFSLNHQTMSAGLCTGKPALLLGGRVWVSGSLGGTYWWLLPLLLLLHIFLFWNCTVEDAQQDHSILAAGVPFLSVCLNFWMLLQKLLNMLFPSNCSVVHERLTRICQFMSSGWSHWKDNDLLTIYKTCLGVRCYTMA